MKMTEERMIDFSYEKCPRCEERALIRNPKWEE